MKKEREGRNICGASNGCIREGRKVWKARKGETEEEKDRYGELVKGGRNTIRKVRGATTCICTVVMGKKDEEKDRY